MPWKGKAYRHKFSRHSKGQRHYKTGALKTVNRRGDFLGFDLLPLPETVERPRLKRRLRVLSLFSGIESGLVALQKLGLCVEKYFSCEIAENALKVQRFHFYNEITFLGDVCSLNEEQLEALGTIDLLYGGNPCQDFSLRNRSRKGLHGAGSSGLLFYEFNRILKFLLQKSRKIGVHLFWFLENTASMEIAVKDEMSSDLGCAPVKLCSSKFVPMRRKRYFWGNIPCMSSGERLPKCSLTLQSFLRPYRTANVTSLPTITSTSHSQLSGHARTFPVLEEGKESLMFVSELELLFGFKAHFTDAGDLSKTSRRKLIGNTWSVHVIEHLLKPLTIIYACETRSNKPSN